MNRQHRQLVAHIQASGKELLDNLKHLSEEEIFRVPAPNEWTMHAVIAHVRDTERHVFLHRIQRILSEPDPPQVENFDQEQWNRDYYSATEPFDQIVAEWRAARRKLVRLLQSTRDADWARYAAHPLYGKISVEYIALHNYAHTLEHLHQMLETREQALLHALNA
jgi:hypothetical protein